MASIKKSRSKRSEPELIEIKNTSRKTTRSTKKKSDLIGDKKNYSNETVERNSGPRAVVMDGPGRGTRSLSVMKSESTGVAQRQIREESVEVESISEKSDLGNDEVRFFCNDKREIGEMVQCEICGMVPFGVSKNERRSWCAGWEDLRLLFLSICESVGIDKVGW